MLAYGNRTCTFAQRTVVQFLFEFLITQFGETLFPQTIETGQVNTLLSFHRSQIIGIRTGKRISRLVLHIAFHQQILRTDLQQAGAKTFLHVFLEP